MSRGSIVFAACSALVVIAFVTLVWSGFQYGAEPDPDSSVWIAVARQTGTTNVVSSIYLGARLLDTLLEVLVFTVAVLGVRHYLELPATEESRIEPIPESHVVGVSAYVLLPWILLVGVYVTLYGHVSPGGGFSGGVIAASGLLLVAAAAGPKSIERRFDERRSERIEWGVLVALFAFALLPAALGLAPLSDPLPPGTPGRLLSGGSILPYNAIIGIKVFVGSWAIVHHFVRHRGEI
jgi:multicomponent Na+:H+ antiporter subunit B